MVAFVKFNKFVETVAAGIAGNMFTGSTDAFKIMLTNTAPTAATNKVYADVSGTEVTGGGATGYTAGGNAAAFSTGAVTTGTLKLVLTSPTAWTASTDTMGPFRYAILYNSTPAAKPLIAFADYGTSITLQNTETFTVTLDGTNGVLTLA